MLVCIPKGELYAESAVELCILLMLVYIKSFLLLHFDNITAAVAKPYYSDISVLFCSFFFFK